MTKSALTILEDDHKQLKRWFADFEDLTPRAVKGMEELRDKIVPLLSQHGAIEERVLYPFVIESLPDLEADVLEGMAEHGVAEQVLAEVAAMSVEDRWFRPKMSVLIEMVRHHIDEEESELFERLRKEFDQAQLQELGAELETSRETAPTVPPPAAQARALLEGVGDRAKDVLHRVTHLVRN
jgi:hemerythrin-like domain-containing protein